MRVTLSVVRDIAVEYLTRFTKKDAGKRSLLGKCP